MTNDSLIESTIRWIRRMYGAWPYALGLPGGYATGRFCLFELPPPISDLTSMTALQPAREIEVLMFDFRAPDRRWAYRMQSTSDWFPVEPALTRERKWYVHKTPHPGERWRQRGLLTTYVVVRVTDLLAIVRSDLPGAWRTAEVDLNEFLKEWELA